jgi:hypothetical protein
LVGEDHGSDSVGVNSHEEDTLVVECGSVGGIAREQGRRVANIDVVIVILDSEANDGWSAVSKVDEMTSDLVGVLP